jgi:hypothetical protein
VSEGHVSVSAGLPPAPRGTIRILVERGGNRELVELPSALAALCRLGVHAVGPDRRGVGRGKGKRWKGARNGGKKLPGHCEERASLPSLSLRAGAGARSSQ